MAPKETQKNCFVIAPIDKEGSVIRRRSDNVLKFIINPVAYDCGYKAIRADEISEPGIITNQIIQHILEDDLVIADLTDGNPNVFYELALRHMTEKPYVQIAQGLGPLPFDVAPARTIYFLENDKSSIDSAKEELRKQIKATEVTASVESPISVGVKILQLRRSDNLAEESNAEILSMLQDLRGEFVRSVRQQSERISELQSILAINSQNYLEAKSPSTGIAQYAVSSISKKRDWDNFIGQIGLFDRSNLVELLDDLQRQNTPYAYKPHTTYDYGSYSYAPYGFQISTEVNGDYRIEFFTHTIDVRKEDLKNFREYVAQRGIYAGVADTRR
jgi:hypothetical protein